jgi:phage gpG-like protein
MSKEDEISRDELIENLEHFQDDFKDSITSKSTQLKALIGGASSLAMISSFLLGRKSGKKSKSGSDSETAE